VLENLRGTHQEIIQKVQQAKQTRINHEQELQSQREVTQHALEVFEPINEVFMGIIVRGKA
jgi:hypothetical protein